MAVGRLRQKISDDTPKKKASTPNKIHTPKKSKETDSGVKKANGVWTEEKRSRLMAMVLDAGYKQMNLDSLAAEVSFICRTVVQM